MAKTREPRYTVRFNGGEFETEHPLPVARAERVARRGIGEFGRFKNGIAELVDQPSGEVIYSVMEV